MKRRYSQVGTASGPTGRAIVRYGVPGSVARPFKRVRVQGGSLVPYGRTTYIVPNPLRQGVRNVKKGVDTPIVDSAVDSPMDSTVGIYTLNLLQAGTGSWNRIGRIIQMSSVRLRLKFAWNWQVSPFAVTTPGVASPPNPLDGRSVRMVILYDKQPNGTLPQKSEIFQYKMADGTEIGDWNGLLAYDNMERFVIIRDEVFTMTPPPMTQLFQYNTTVDPPKIIQEAYPPTVLERTVDVYTKLGLRTNYKAESTSPSISDIATGALYVVFLTEPSIANVSPVITVQGIARLRYSDQ